MRYAVRGPMRPVVRFFCLSVLCSAPSLAAAEACGDLEVERSRVARSATELVTQYPGTHLVIGICAATASSEYERTKKAEDAAGVFALCAAGACALAGFDNCGEVTKQWFALALSDGQLTSRMRTLGCPS